MKMLYMYDNKNFGMYEIFSLFIIFNFINLDYFILYSEICII